MKHPEELKTEFLELRARGVSYSRIAEAIGVSKPTLIQWGKDMAEEIADLQAAERELVREKLLGNFEQWLGRQVHHFNRLDEEFGRRELKYSPTESVFRMMMASRKLLDRYFFEDDRPRARRDNGRAAAPSAAAPTASNPHLDHNHDLAPNPIAAPSSDEMDPQAGSLDAHEYNENPAKTLPFPCQNSGADNPNLSSDSTAASPASPQSELEVGRAAAPSGAAVTTSEPRLDHNHDRNLNPSLEGGQDQSETVIPESEIDFGGESIPISPYESTREWLERQGIQVSKIPKGARVITTG